MSAKTSRKEGSPNKRQSVSGTNDEESEFHWDDYLESSQSQGVPATAFAHVERSLESGLRAGMKLEVRTPGCEGFYWLASVVTTCGPLLSLRYLGYGADRSADFWCDVGTNEVHPLGWCAQHQKPLRPPQAIKDRLLDWEKLLDKELENAVTVPAYVLEMKGSAPIDQIQQGMKLLVLEEGNPLNGWAASVLENVGGRLLLRYDGCEVATWDIWLFYLSHRVKALDPPSHGEQTYRPPQCIESLHTLDQWKRILKDSMDEAQKYNSKILANILQPPVALQEHSFKVGHKVELLHPLTRQEACPATVTATLGSGPWFVVQVDDLRHPKEVPSVSRCCHANSQTLLPVGWAQAHGLPLVTPPGYACKEFNWDDYLASCGAEAAPESCFHLEEDTLGFEVGQKLEAVNVHRPNEVCVATVERVCPPLAWLRLEGQGVVVQPLRSQQLFPVGWCATNGYPLRTPGDYPQRAPKVAAAPGRRAPVAPQETSSKSKKTEKKDSKPGARSWCPSIYLNHRCFSGPFLSKGRLAELPRQIGPGPVALVLREVLSQVIGVAYKSSRVLSELQLKGTPTPGMHQQLLKAKYKGKTYRAVVETVRWSSEVESFCRSVCTRLQCCPNLFGPRAFGDEECPEKCSSLTKTKYSYQFVRKRQRRPMALRKPKRPRTESPEDPPGNRDSKPVSPHPRRLQQEKPPAPPPEQGDSGESSGDSSAPPSKTASSERPGVKTRGARLPDFKNLNLDLRWQRSLKPRLLASRGPSRADTPDSVSSEGGTPETVRTSASPALPASEPAASNRLTLDTNPLEWSVSDVARFVGTTDCSSLAKVLEQQEIDGQALLLLTLPLVQEFLELQLAPAVQFCRLLERVKLAFYIQYAK